MATLFDIFKFNNISYAELTDNVGKKEIELWIDKLENTDIAIQILRDFLGGCINIRTIGKADEDRDYIVDMIPKDLFVEALKIIYP